MNKTVKLAFVVCLIVMRLFPVNTVTAQPPIINETQILATNVSELDLFGASVAVSGDGKTIVVGAPWSERPFPIHDTNKDRGAVFVFQFNDSTGQWQEQSLLIFYNSEGAEEMFGTSVAISEDGNVIVVGAPGNDFPAYDCGEVYIFERNGTEWALVQMFMGSGERYRFGWSVAIHKDLLVIGTPGAALSEYGPVKVFRRTGTSWDTWGPVGLLKQSDQTAYDEFGASVAINEDENIIVVGAPEKDDGRGAAYVYELVDLPARHWKETRLTPDTYPIVPPHYGWSVGISGETVVVGSPGELVGAIDQGSGVVYVFERDGSWTQVARLLASDYDQHTSAAPMGFGASVDISGDKIVVGAPDYDTACSPYIFGGCDSGSAYIFQQIGAIWDVAQLLSTDNHLGDNFGSSVAISGQMAVVGAYARGSDLVGSENNYPGCAYVFHLPGLVPIYVDADATGANNGTSWADAYTNLQEALAVAMSNKVIFVAEGIYKPDEGGGQTSGDRTATFQLRNVVAIMGGYAGFGELNPNARDLDRYKTILTGDLNEDDDGFTHNGENSYHVVTGNVTDDTVVLDGFTVKTGNASGSAPEEKKGGGIYKSYGLITNCIFTGNTAMEDGGAIYESHGPIINCIFNGNTAVNNGGGIYENHGPVTNCTFSSNMASVNGAGIYHNIGPVTNCIFWHNTDSGGSDETAQIHEVEAPINYCNVEGWTGSWSGTGNIGVDPLLADAYGPNGIAGTEDDKLWLLAGSLCIDAGDNAAVRAVPVVVTTDIDGNPRFVDIPCIGKGPPPIVDMGAYELPAKAWKPEPADGAEHKDTWVTLTWMPGGCAVLHDVYFGDNFNAVNDGTTETYQGNQSSTFFVAGFPGFPFPDGLVPGTTYYWRIDEVNADSSIHKGDVWSFMVPPKTAYNPDPPDGASFIDPDVTLSWTAGFGAILHHMYFGENSSEVEDGTGDTYKALVGNTSYVPGTLEQGKTYYWRVDEYDRIDIYEGDVWSFTTIP